MKYIKPADIEWKRVRYIKLPLSGDDNTSKWLYEFWLNEPLASWDVFSYWEVERILSMRKNLAKGDVLFDIGTEQGWCNLAYADMVGAENMVLIEPTQEFWGNIRTLWEKNYDKKPLAFYDGFFSDKTTDSRNVDFTKWVKASKNDIIDRNKYQYIHDNYEKVPEITLDDYVAKTGIIPNAITMDTEGSELLILRGAINTLKQNNLKVWVSIHDDLGLENYGIKDTDTVEFLESLGYKGEFLAKDHEQHWYFEK